MPRRVKRKYAMSYHIHAGEHYHESEKVVAMDVYRPDPERNSGCKDPNKEQCEEDQNKQEHLSERHIVRNTDGEAGNESEI